MSVCMYVCVYVCMYICMYACMYVCMCVYVCMYYVRMYVFGALTRSWESEVSIEKRLRSQVWILSPPVQAGNGVHTVSYSPILRDPF
jgi:hypothetical protein